MAVAPAPINCIGLGCPKTPGGLDRYVYKFTHHLTTAQDRTDLYSLGLLETNPIPDSDRTSLKGLQSNSRVKLINLASQNNSLWQIFSKFDCQF